MYCHSVTFIYIYYRFICYSYNTLIIHEVLIIKRVDICNIYMYAFLFNKKKKQKKIKRRKK